MTGSPIKAAQCFHFMEGHVLSVSSSNDGRLGCSHLVATVENDAVHMGACVSAQIHCFEFWAHRPSAGPAGSYGGSMCFYLYSLLKYWFTMLWR